MRSLTVLFDPACGFCIRCRDWLARQPALVPLTFLAAASEEARARFPTLPQPDPPEELVVVDDEGGVYRGHDAWIMCLYALADYREWALRLAGPRLKPLSRAAFAWISRNRTALSRRLLKAPPEEVERAFTPPPIGCARPALPPPPPPARRAR
jgi:predicted DCC family thiol-disulfide oxidoreductase YuxK